jgi:hypothetical protein
MAWNKSNEVYNYDQHSGPTVVFAGDTTSGAPPHYAPDVWHTIDLKPLGVTADAKFAEITGFLIITDLGSEIDNLTATFRPPGSTLNEGNYQMQAISVWSGGGERQVQSVTVALVNGCFEFYWKKQVGGVSENGHPSSFLLNLRLSKWGRFEPAGSDQSAAIAALQSDIATLQSIVAALLDHAPAISSLQDRVAALETAPPPPSQPTVITVPPEGITVQFVQAQS